MRRITFATIAGRLRRTSIPEEAWPIPADVADDDRPAPFRGARPAITLATTALCDKRPFEHLSECVRDADHAGVCVIARRVPGGAEFYRATPAGPVLDHHRPLSYPDPMRLELAEHWAWREALMPRGELAELDAPVARDLGWAA